MRELGTFRIFAREIVLIGMFRIFALRIVRELGTVRIFAREIVRVRAVSA